MSERLVPVEQLLNVYQRGILNIVGHIYRLRDAGRDEKAARIALTKSIEELEHLQGYTDEWIEQNVPASYREGWDGAFKSTLYATPDGFGSSIKYENFVVLNKNAIEQVAYAMQNKMDAAILQVGRQVDDIYRQKGLEATVTRLFTGETIRDTRKALARELLDQTGVPYFTDQSGRKWRLDNYAHMVARTTTREATTMGTLTRARAGGYHLVQLSEHHPTCELCAPLQGLVYTMDPQDKRYPEWQDDYCPVHPNCYSKDTEVYTEHGWLPFSKVKQGDKIMSMNPNTLIMEWVPVAKAIRVYSNKMLNFKTNQFDLLVTPNHRMFYQNSTNRKKKINKWEFRTAEELFDKKDGCFLQGANWEGSYLKAVEIDGTKMDGETYAELMGWYLSEGSVDVIKKGNYSLGRICISQCKEKNPEKWQEIKSLLDHIGWKYSYSGGRFVVYHGYDYFNQFKKSGDKYVPEIIKRATPDIIKIFLDAFVMGDGHVRKNMKPFKGGKYRQEKVYTTSSIRLAADIGELLLKIGRRPSFTELKTAGKEVQHRNGKYKTKRNIWIIRECSAQRAWLCNMKRSVVDYNDYAYDVELEKYHVLLVRRNGKVAWSGNCLHVVYVYIDRYDPNAEETMRRSQAFDPNVDPRSEAEKRAYNNLQGENRRLNDLRNQHSRYKARLGDKAPPIQTFSRIKNQGGERWAQLQQQYREAGQGTGAVKASSTTFKEVLMAKEKSLVNRETEKVFVLDDRGNIILEKSGERSQVAFTKAEVKLFKDKVLTHNHPGGSSFSPQDILLADRQNVKEIRAVTKEYIHSVKRPEDGWPTEYYNKVTGETNYLINHMNNKDREVRIKFMDAIHNGAMDIQTANKLHHHTVWSELAEEIGLRYSREGWQ